MKHSGLNLCHIVNFFSSTKLLTRAESLLAIQVCMLSMQEGHCFANNSYLGKRIGISDETKISKMLAHLKLVGLFDISGLGRNRIITPLFNNFIISQNCQETSTDLSFSNNLSLVETTKVDSPTLVEMTNSNNLSLVETANVTLVETTNPTLVETTKVPCISYKEKIKEKIKEEVVLSAAPRQPDTTLFFTASFFERDPAKEQISLEVRKRLIEIYGRDNVTKFEANALKAMIKSAEEGHANGKFYKRGLEEITRDFCEQEQKRLAERKLLTEKKNEKKILSCEDLVELRRKKILNDEFISKFVTVDANGFFVKESKLSTQEYNSLSKTGMAFDDSNRDSSCGYDSQFLILYDELRRIARQKSYNII